MLKKRLSLLIASVFGLATASPLMAVDKLAVKHSPTKEATQMWNLEDANIRAVIQTISQLTGKNFVVDPRVQGKVTLFSAKPMTTGEMYKSFLSMLQVLNYVAIPSGNIIKIVPAMDAKGYGGTLVNGKIRGAGDQVVVRVVPVNNVSSDQLVSILRPLMLDWGSVNAYQPSNSLVLAGTASNVAQLVKIVKNLDQNNGSTPEVIKLHYADATKLAQVVQSLQSASAMQGKVSNVAVVADPGENALLVSGNKTNRINMTKLIRQLDTQNAAGGNNTAVIHLNYLTAKKLAPMLTKVAHGYVQQAKNKSTAGTSFGVGSADDASVSIQSVDDDNAVVISGPHEIVTSLKNVVKKIDTRPQEVLVQAIIVKISESEMAKLGVQWGMGNPEAGATSGGDDSASGALSSAFQNGVGYFTSGSFGGIVHALTTSGDTDILSTPSVLVLNNQKADISDGKNVGLINREYSTNSNDSSDSSVPYNTIDRKDVTLSLQVTPQIAPDNTVRLKITHKDDSLATDVQDQTGNPTINTSKIDTTVLVNSGDVLVLGGLIDNNDTLTDSKIPILGDIPGIGRLFHFKTHSVDKKNLMVFIRPVIINNRQQANQQSIKKYDYVRYQQIRKRNGLTMSNADRYPVLPFRHSKQTSILPPPFE